MKEIFKLNLQLFAGEGTAGTAGSSGAGGDGAGTTGDHGASAPATADAEQRLLELGVPEDKIRKRASKATSRTPAPTAQIPAAGPAEEAAVAPAATQKPTTEDTKDTPKRMTWEEIMADPEYNKQMQATMRARLKSERSAEEALGKMAPAIEVLARKYDLDPENMDYGALAKAINDDDAYYEDKALEMGTSVETAKKFDQMERDSEREKRTLQDQALSQHFARLEQQGAELKKIFPGFDLRKELENPVFVRMTAPGKGIMSVEDAYRAVHRKEIEAASSQFIAKKTAENLSNAIQSGSRRPNESGSSSQAPSVTHFDYSKASKQQREAFKSDLRARMARGEKVYPGQH